MQTYKITDPTSGRTLRLTGDSPPTEKEIMQVFETIGTQTGQPVTPPPPPSDPGYMSRLSGDFDTRIGKSETIRNDPNMTEVEKRIGYAGQGLGMASDVLTEGVSSAYSMLPDFVQKELASAGKAVLSSRPILESRSVNDTSQVPSISEKIGMGAEEYGKFAKENPRAANITGAIGNAANLAGGLTMVDPAGKVTGMAAKGLAKGGVKGASAVAGIVSPKQTPEKALREVLHSRERTLAQRAADFKKGPEALAAIDTTGVKTYADLVKKFEEKVPELRKVQDAVLMQDPTIYNMDALTVAEKSKGGRVVKTNYVGKALDDLEELYTKRGEGVKAADIQELKERLKFPEEGLTKKEVNDLAVTYGNEFDAFNPTTGVPLTSVSGEAFEITRKGLKTVSRAGMSGEAKELDQVLSSILNTKRLAQRNALEAAQLKDKYQARGILEKMGGTIANAIDLATGHSLRGMVTKIIPSGAGYKVMDAAKLEDALAKNLKVIRADAERLRKIPITRKP